MSMPAATRLLTALLFASTLLSGCSERSKITELKQLDGMEVALPTGTVADQLVLAKLPNAKIKYFNTVLDAAIAGTKSNHPSIFCIFQRNARFTHHR